MAGEESPDAAPPEVPAEFAAAYQEAYRRALDEDGPTMAPAPERVTEYRTGMLDRPLGGRAFLPVAAALGVLATVVVVWLLGRALAGDDAGDATPDTTSPTPAPTATLPGRTEPLGKRHEGEVAAVQPRKVTATCTMPPGEDAAGRTVTYRPAHAVDGDPVTAWRCAGDAVGQRLVLRLPRGTTIAEVGLVPGYAKTDPADGADRYAENNRITRVRWTLAPGVAFEQRIDPDPEKRDLQLLRVPGTVTDRVVLEVVEVQPGSRRTTAISEIRLSVPQP